MLGLLLLPFITTFNVLLACDLTGRVDLASSKLLVTCECRGPRDDIHDVTSIHSLMMNEKRHFAHQTFLAKLEDGRLKVNKYARKNRVVDHRISETQDSALLTLAFSSRRKYDFTCTVRGHNRTGLVVLPLKFMYDPKDYSTRTPPPPPPPTTKTTTTTTTTTETTASETTTTEATEAITPAATASTTASASSSPSQENVLHIEGQITGDHSSSDKSSHASSTEIVERRTTTKSPTTKTTVTTSTDMPEINQIVPTDEKSEKFTQTMIIIVCVFAFFSAAILAVSILGMVRRESTATARHTSCTDAIPWDLLRNFLTATTSQGRAGQKHVTSSPPYSIDSESDTIASGSYAMCLTDMSSLDDADRDDAGRPFLPNDDVTLSGRSDDVSTPAPPKRIIFENELSNTSDTDDASDSYSVSVSSMSRTNMPTSAMGILGERGPPSLGQRSRAPCRHHHRRHLTCDRERPCIQAAQQQRGPSIEITPSRQLFSELSLPAQSGYVQETASQSRVLDHSQAALRLMTHAGEQSCVQRHNQPALHSQALAGEQSCVQRHNQPALHSQALAGEQSCVQRHNQSTLRSQALAGEQSRVQGHNQSTLRSQALAGEQSRVQGHNQSTLRSQALAGEQSCVQSHNQSMLRSQALAGEQSRVQGHNQSTLRSQALAGEQSRVQGHNQSTLRSQALAGEQSCVQGHNQSTLRSQALAGEQSCVQRHNQPALRSQALAAEQSHLQRHNQPALRSLAEAQKRRTALDLASPAERVGVVRQGSALAPQRCGTSLVHRSDLYLTPVDKM